MQTPDDTHKHDESGTVTRLLAEMSHGDETPTDDLFPLVYEELNRLARKLRRQGPGATLNTTALVHEAYLKLVRSDDIAWEGRRHFFAVAARAMRQVLVRDAERRRTAKRGGGQADVTLNEAVHAGPMRDADLLALHMALERLGTLDPRQASVVELRFFAGLTIDESANVLGISAATVNRDWTLARVWLARELAP